MNIHLPVLLAEVLEALKSPLSRKNSIFFDGTLGGGGHSEALLKEFPETKGIGGDFDLNAVKLCKERLAPYIAQKRFEVVHTAFSDFVREAEEESLDAIFVDLGYSSNQLEASEFGMSFQIEGPLDMRLARPPTGDSAWDVLVNSSEAELAKIFEVYGEAEGSKRVAAKIKVAIQSGEVTNSTLSLARFLDRVQPRGGKKAIHPATKFFQALRICVNDELRSLDVFLKSATLKLKPGGRLAVISFHSLEDRIVKRLQQSGGSLRSVTSRPLEATEDEVRKNPRARSAKLRVYER